MFITFGYGQKINGVSLSNKYMIIKEEEIPNVIERNEDGFYVFCARHGDGDLQKQINRYGIKEITPAEYIAIRDKPKQDIVSPTMVLKSAAGYYVGTLYWDADMNGWFPYSRDTDYMTAEEAIGTVYRWLQELGAPE